MKVLSIILAIFCWSCSAQGYKIAFEDGPFAQNGTCFRIGNAIYTGYHISHGIDWKTCRVEVEGQWHNLGVPIKVDRQLDVIAFNSIGKLKALEYAKHAIGSCTLYSNVVKDGAMMTLKGRVRRLWYSVGSLHYLVDQKYLYSNKAGSGSPVIQNGKVVGMVYGHSLKSGNDSGVVVLPAKYIVEGI